MARRQSDRVRGRPLVALILWIGVLTGATGLAGRAMAVAPPEDDPPRLSEARTVSLRRVEIEGNTVVDDETLLAIAEPFLDRPVSMEDLQALRLALTRAYVDRGFVSSGATLPDQTVTGGVIRFRIVEGRLGRVRVEGNERFEADVLAARLRLPPDAVVDLAAIERRLQMMRQDPRIDRVAAELRPGFEPGVAELHVRVAEARPWQVSVQFDNHVSPAIGELRGTAFMSHLNLTGVGDTLRGSLGGSEGLIDVDLEYQRPVNRHQTRIGLYARYSEAEIVEDPFDELNIESSLMQLALEVIQPFRPDLQTTVELGLTGEWIQSRSTLDGVSFDFTPGSERGITRVAALRFFQSLSHQTANHGIFGSSTLSIGVPILRATEHSGSREDSRFVSWLARAQWVQRMPLDSLLVVRGELQLASEPLLPIERYSLGGFESVRGFRQNQLVRDTGFASSVELRVPIWTASEKRSRIELAPFFDAGRSWNSGRGGTRSPKRLLGAGVGIRGEFAGGVYADLYWAEAIGDRPKPSERSLQDRGLYFRITARYP